MNKHNILLLAFISSGMLQGFGPHGAPATVEDGSLYYASAREDAKPLFTVSRTTTAIITAVATAGALVYWYKFHHMPPIIARLGKLETQVATFSKNSADAHKITHDKLNKVEDLVSSTGVKHRTTMETNHADIVDKLARARGIMHSRFNGAEESAAQRHNEVTGKLDEILSAVKKD